MDAIRFQYRALFRDPCKMPGCAASSPAWGDAELIGDKVPVQDDGENERRYAGTHEGTISLGGRRFFDFLRFARSGGA